MSRTSNRILLAAATGIFAAMATPSFGALVAGDIAIIGRTNNTTPDVFAFVPLTSISAGEVIYFTDNGWTGTGFRNTVNDGDGNEGLLKFEATATISAGTIIRSNDTSANFAFTKTGVVPGAATGSFADLALNTGGEQIYAFQGPTNLPLANPTTHLFVLDDTNGFENAAGTGDGNVPTGLTLGTTALTFTNAVAGTMAFNTSALTSGTKDEWLTAIGNSANWTFTTATLPSGSINVTAVPEPGTLAVAPLAGLLLARRRRNARA